MANITDTFTKNAFIDKCMKFIPDDPLTQSKYMYILTGIVFLGISGFAITSWYNFFNTFEVKTAFFSLFMSAVAIMSLFGLKQTRSAYHSIKSLYKIKENPPKEMKIENVKQMLEGFK